MIITHINCEKETTRYAYDLSFFLIFLNYRNFQILQFYENKLFSILMSFVKINGTIYQIGFPKSESIYYNFFF